MLFIQAILCAAAAVFFVLGVTLLVRHYQVVQTRKRQIAFEALSDIREYSVLFLSSYSQTHFSVPQQYEGLQKGFENNPVTMDALYMNTKNFSGEAYMEAFTRYCEASLEGKSYDVLIVGDDAALSFADEHRKDFFRDIPVVFLGINNITYASKVHAEGWATGIPEESDMVDTYLTAARLFPAADTFVSVVDNSPSGQGDLEQLMEIQKKLHGYKFETINSSELTQKDFIARIEALEDNTILFELDAYEDLDGNVYTIDDMIRLLNAHTDRPIFRASTGGVGAGALGSGFLDFETIGQAAAGLALAIIEGENPRYIPMERISKNGYVFDKAMMDHFGIESADLPQDSTILNVEETFFNQYSAVIIPVLLVLASAVCVIIVLILGLFHVRHNARALLEQSQALEHELYYDHLTDLPNRNGMKYLYSEVTFSGVCVVDIDGFKFINEKYGHQAGDTILREIARRLRSFADVLPARIGADEFLIGFENNRGNLSERLDEVLAAMSVPYYYGGTEIKLTECAGAARREQDESLELLITNSELAMYEAKQIDHIAGFRFYTTEIRDKIGTLRAMVEDLEKAIQEKTIIVLFQPQVEAETREIYGYEALCRFPGNRYYPNRFIPVAEENGLIIPLDRLVTEKVVRQLSEWRKEGLPDRVVSVNYSSKQLIDTEYVAYVKELLKQYDVPASLLKIEITESGVFSDEDRVHSFFDSFRRMGIQIALDDYGTGYSSITAMTTFPVDYIKFDKSLIDQYLHRGDDVLIRNLVHLAHGLGKKLVAEGIETKDQYEHAREIGIDQIQGYYFSRALPAEEAARQDFRDK